MGMVGVRKTRDCTMGVSGMAGWDGCVRERCEGEMPGRDVRERCQGEMLLRYPCMHGPVDLARVRTYVLTKYVPINCMQIGFIAYHQICYPLH